MKFEVANELAPPPAGGWVRLQRLRGEWRFARDGDDVTVEYVSYSEPGGTVPAFVSEGPRRRSEVDVVKRLLARAASAR